MFQSPCELVYIDVSEHAEGEACLPTIIHSAAPQEAIVKSRLIEVTWVCSSAALRSHKASFSSILGSNKDVLGYKVELEQHFHYSEKA